MLKLGPIQVRWRDTINFGGGMTGSRGLPTKVRTLPQKIAKSRHQCKGVKERSVATWPHLILA